MQYPVPISYILHGIVVYQFLCKILFSFSPVYLVNSTEQHCCTHSYSIGHKSSLIHLPHSSVRKRKSRFSLFPQTKEFFSPFTFCFFPVVISGFFRIYFVVGKNLRIVISQVLPEIIPIKLLYDLGLLLS